MWLKTTLYSLLGALPIIGLSAEYAPAAPLESALAASQTMQCSQLRAPAHSDVTFVSCGGFF